MADGKQELHFLLTFPGAGREGTIWKEKVRSLKNIYILINCQDLMGRGCLGSGERRGAQGDVVMGVGWGLCSSSEFQGATW